MAANVTGRVWLLEKLVKRTLTQSMPTQIDFPGWLTMAGEWAIAIVIGYEIWVALSEYRNSRMFEAIKYVEDDTTRAARRVIYEKLRRSKPQFEDWWEHDTTLADAAAHVCARYNLLGAVTKDDKKVRRFVVQEWAHNICSTHDALASYIRYREAETPGAFRRYTDLYREAMAHKAAEKSN